MIRAETDILIEVERSHMREVETFLAMLARE